MQTIREGDKSELVRVVQGLLRAHGWPVDLDGDFGPQTASAVEAFQLQAGLRPVEGPIVVDRATWVALVDGTQADVSARPVPVAASTLNAARAPVDATVSGVMAVARAVVGFGEDPPGSNGGPMIARIVGDLGPGGPYRSAYFRAMRMDPARYATTLPPWCALFVSWALLGDRAADVRTMTPADWKKHPFGAWFGGVAQIEEWGKARGSFVDAVGGGGVLAAAPVGAIFTMGRSGSGSDESLVGGHTGFVAADRGDAVLTVEGNTSNRVASLMRPKTSLRGYVRWW